jgi:hypothetical protein
MIPIYEQGQGQGIGHGLDSFLRRFEQICQEHLEAGRARAFAFIFYDFQDKALRRILKDQGVFAQLDRLSGASLSVFYLHAGTRHSVEKFNTAFLSALGVEDEAQLPCVVFFRYNEQEIRDVAIAQLDNANLLHGFHELYGVIERYTKAAPDISAEPSRYLKWLTAGSKLVSLEAFRAALRWALDLLM